MKKKDEVVQIIRKYIAKVERDKGLKVKRFRMDNGLEYCNRQTRELFDELGIKHERTCVETPQMNGVAERLNRTLMNLATAMLLSAKLPSYFWAEASSAATYARNRMIHSSIKEGVPEGIWTGHTSNVKHLKIFGCVAYAHQPSQGRRKLDQRAHECIMVGYSNQTKGYRLWDPKRKKILQTNHVRLDEEKIGYEVIHNKNLVQVEFVSSQIENKKTSEESTKQDELRTTTGTRQDSKFTQVFEDDDNEDLETYTDEKEELNKTEDSAIVGASVIDETIKKGGRGRPKKPPPRNPYGRKGKPKTDVEVNFTEIIEPRSLEEAMSSPQANRWKQAIEEMNDLEQHHVWVPTLLTKNKRYIGSKWVFKLKPDAEEKIARYKARLVAHWASPRNRVWIMGKRMHQ